MTAGESTVYRGHCPNCNRGLPLVKGWGKHLASVFFDCFHCGIAGRHNLSSGTTEELVVNTPPWKWWKKKGQ